MGGRSSYAGRVTSSDDYADREAWIKEVSNDRLATYERMLTSPEARVVRADGSTRNFQGQYFRDLVSREKSRREK